MFVPGKCYLHFVKNLFKLVRSWKLQYFDKYLHNKHILEYAQILVTGGKFMIFDIKGHPTIFRPIVWRDQIADQIGFPKGPIR